MFIIVANYESQMCMFVRIELTAMVRFTDRHETIPISRPTDRPTDRPKNNTETLRSDVPNHLYSVQNVRSMKLTRTR